MGAAPSSCNATLPATFYVQSSANTSVYYYVNPTTGGTVAPATSSNSPTKFYSASVCLGNETNTPCFNQLSFTTPNNSTFGAYVSTTGGAVTFQQILSGNTFLVNGLTPVAPSWDSCAKVVSLVPYAIADITPTADVNNTYSCANSVLNMGVGKSTQCSKTNLTETAAS